MKKPIRIALDAMGGDYGPKETVAGAVQAIQDSEIAMQLIGNPEMVTAELNKYPNSDDMDITVIPSEGVIYENEQPAKGLRQKNRASIVVATELVATKRADACVSMGSTGASMAAAAVILGLMDRIKRPCLGGPIIGLAPKTIIIDVGTSVDCKPVQLLSFAIIGEVFANTFWNINDPTIGILSVGSESGKGNKQVRETTELLKSSGLNFVGNVEASDLPKGIVNVVVCDGFVGNVVMKLTEGLGAELAKHLTESLKKTIDPKVAAAIETQIFKVTNPGLTYGAGPLLGVNGISLAGHGKSKRYEIAVAIATAKRAVELDFVAQMKNRLSKTLTIVTENGTDKR